MISCAVPSHDTKRNIFPFFSIVFGRELHQILRLRKNFGAASIKFCTEVGRGDAGSVAYKEFMSKRVFQIINTAGYRLPGDIQFFGGFAEAFLLEGFHKSLHIYQSYFKKIHFNFTFPTSTTCLLDKLFFSAQ